MMPSGATCTAPAALAVVTIVSRIIGIGGVLRARRSQRMSDLPQTREILARRIDGGAPVERLVLGVALPQAPGDLGLHQFGPEIERMRAVRLDGEPREQRERVLRHMVAGSVV